MWNTANVTGSSTPVPTASTTSAGRPTRSPSSSPRRRPTRDGAFSVDAQGAEGLRRHPRHLRRRRRRAGREGRLPDRPLRDDDAEEGPDRDDDHAHVLGPRLVALRGRRVAPVRQQIHRRDHGQLDPRRRSVRIRASGPVGKHTIDIADAISFDYLNIPQSPIPWATGAKFTFKVTKDDGRPAARMDWPAPWRRRSTRETTMAPRPRRRQQAASARSARRPGRSLEGRRRGCGLAERAGRPRVVDRRRQPRQLHRHVLELRLVPLGTATAAAGTSRSTVTVPDGLGGWHVIQLSRAGGDGPGAVLREAQRRRQRRLVAALKQGQPFTSTSRASAGRSSTTRSRSTTTTATSATAAGSTRTATSS